MRGNDLKYFMQFIKTSINIENLDISENMSAFKSFSQHNYSSILPDARQNFLRQVIIENKTFENKTSLNEIFDSIQLLQVRMISITGCIFKNDVL